MKAKLLNSVRELRSTSKEWEEIKRVELGNQQIEAKPWPMYDEDFNDFAIEFKPVCDMREDIDQHTFLNHHPNLVELGGPARNLRITFPREVNMSVGATILDLGTKEQRGRDQRIKHHVLERDIWDPSLYRDLGARFSPEGGIDIVISRLGMGLRSLGRSKVPGAQLYLLDKAYRILNPMGLMFVEAARWFKDDSHIHELIAKFQEHMSGKNWYQGEVVRDYIGKHLLVRIEKNRSAPERLPLRELLK